jgi:hypothetical protein
MNRIRFGVTIGVFALASIPAVAGTGRAQGTGGESDSRWSHLAVVELTGEHGPSGEWIEELNASGGALRLVAGKLAWVDLPPEAEVRVSQQHGTRRVHRQSWAGVSAPLPERSASDLLGLVRRGEAFAPPPPGADPLAGDVLVAPDPPGIRTTCGTIVDYWEWPPTYGPFLGRTHIMQGLVTANFFLVESDAGNPENAYDWDSAEISLAATEIQEALVWWSTVAGIFGHSLAFDLRLHTPDLYECQVPGEPTIHNSAWVQDVLVPSVMQRLGFNDLYGRCATGRFNESTIGPNDRAFSAFILDGNNYLSDGYFAWAAGFNGPYLMSLRRPDQYGTNHLNDVVQHEMAHLFRACDEYSQPGYGGCMDCEPCVPGGPPNFNCVLSCGSNASCIMRYGDENNDCCGWTRAQIGLDQAYGAPVPVSPPPGAVLSSGEVTLVHLPVFGAPRFQVQVSAVSGFDCPVFFDLDTVDLENTTWCLPEGHFFWRVAGRDGAGNVGSWSATGDFYIDDPPLAPAVEARIVTAPGPVGCTGPPWIRTFSMNGSPDLTSFLAYEYGDFGAKIATGDLDGDGLEEIVTGPGPGAGYPSQIRTFRHDGTPLTQFIAYPTAGFGANVAVGDVDGDGRDEIVTAPGPDISHASLVRVFRQDGTLISEFIAYPTAGFGAVVAAGDVDGDGRDEIVTAPGPNISHTSLIRVFHQDGTLISQFIAYPTAGFGANVAAGDVDGDGRDEIVTAPGPDISHTSLIRVFRQDGTMISEFTAYPTAGFGAAVAAGDLDGDGRDEIVTAPGPAQSHPAQIRIFHQDGTQIAEFDAYPGWLTGGASAAVLGSGPTSFVELDAAGSSPGIDTVTPNPTSRAVEVRFHAPGSEAPRVEILDAVGRLVGELSAQDLGGSRYAARWDGRETRGCLAPCGVYWLRIRAGNAPEATRLVVVR